ncbi:MAG: DUF169 domain-containing protein [Methanohalobium sp.]|uniref:DUF169 domain-containing protein n=1 Tax=Methanohalobium sp. TaxID=2837493 RepID=UPI00397A0C85
MDIEDVKKIGADLIDIFKLKTSPVAVKLVSNVQEIPEGVERIENPTRHCQMIDNVRRTGSSFYTLVDDQKCKGGAAVMGLREMDEKLAKGEVYYKLGSFSTQNAARRTMQMIPRVLSGSIKAVIYEPLEKAEFLPDVVVIIGTPKQMMQMSQALLYKQGGRVNADFAGKQSLCADGVAEPYMSGQICVTVGCGGSRKHTEIQEEEMAIGIPLERLEDMMKSASKMFGK